MSNEEAVMTAPEPTPMDRKAVLINQILIVLGFIGVFIASYLSFARAQDMVLPCLAGSQDCARVDADPTSMVFGMYVGYLGLAGYLILTGISIARGFLAGKDWSLFVKVGLILSIIGTLFSFYLTFVSIAVIRATCQWCIASALTMASICILSYILSGYKAPENPGKPPVLAAGVGLVLAIGLFGGFAAALKSDLEGSIREVELGGLTLTDLLPREEKIMGGGANAPVMLIEFADYNCPACRDSFPHVEEAVKAAGPKLGYAFRAFPLFNKEGHETSLSASLLAEYAADQGKYQEFVHAAFDPKNNANIKQDSGLAIIAEQVGLDSVDVDKVVHDTHPKSEAYLEEVNRDMAQGRSAGVNMTPTFLVFAEGAKPVSVPHNKLAELFSKEPYKSLLQ